MKKLFIILIAIFGLLFSGQVEALTQEEYDALDPDNKIYTPWMVFSTGSSITIKSGITDYKLYDQWIKLSSEDVTKYNKLYNEDYIKIKEEADKYEESATEEQKKTEEYNNKIDEYNKKILEIQAQINELIPTYNDSNWKEITDGKTYAPATAKNEGYVLWVKLVESDNTTTFDTQMYINNSSDEGTSNNTTNKQPTNSQNSNQTTGQTVQTTVNPSTGIEEYIIYVVVSSIIIGSLLILKKQKNVY